MSASRANAALFYGSAFVSSVGNVTCSISMIAFLLKRGDPFATVGTAIAMSRLVPLLVNLTIGHAVDRAGARRLVVALEIACAGLTAALVYLWAKGAAAFWPFLAVYTLRATLVTLQANARARIAKLIGDSVAARDRLHATLLNLATHGATFFGGILGWLAVTYLDFVAVICFDAATFALAGGSMLALTLPEASAPEPGGRFTAKFVDLYRHAREPALRDLALAVAMCGTAALMGRLAAPAKDLLPLFLAGYGLAVWSGAYLSRLPAVARHHAALWAALGGGFLAAACCSAAGHPLAALLLSTLKDTVYWTLFHRYSGEIQARAPVHSYGGVFAARMCQMVAVLAVGELVVGLGEGRWSVVLEGAWRLAFCLAAAAAVGVGITFGRREYARAA